MHILLFLFNRNVNNIFLIVKAYIADQQPYIKKAIHQLTASKFEMYEGFTSTPGVRDIMKNYLDLVKTSYRVIFKIEQGILFAD